MEKVNLVEIILYLIDAIIHMDVTGDRNVRTIRAVGYARVSVREEDINNQVKAIEQYAKENGIELVHVFKDEAVTGASDPFKRDEFKAMYEFCKAYGINTILIYDLTRLGRSLTTAVESLKRLIDEGFNVYFIRHNLKADLSDPASKVMIYTLLMVAELERDFMRMRQEEAWRQGKQKGRPVEITKEEIMNILKQYPNASYRVIHAIINERRRQRGKKPISYSGLIKAMKRYGLVKRIVEG